MGSKLFQDDCGNESMMRVMLFVFMIFCILMVTYILVVWGYIAYVTSTYPQLGISDFLGVFGGIGALFSKALQKKFEESECKQKETEG